MGVLNLAGQAVDRYDVGEQLGQGGFGAVFRARHRVIGNEVALKILWPDHASDPKQVERFLREARAAAAVGNEHIVRVFDAGTTPDGLVFLAMELLDGHDLEVELLERETLPIAEAVELVRHVLDALAAAHSAGIIHRDLKPANIMLVEDASGGRRPKLLDFGISKIRGSKTLTAKGAILGTPQYMAPEQIEGSQGLDARADLYAVGTILYRLLTGSVPFEGEGYDVLVKRIQGARPRNIRLVAPHVSHGLADVIMRSLAFDPDARWQSASAMSVALEAALAGCSIDPRGEAATLPASAAVAATVLASRPPPSMAPPGPSVPPIGVSTQVVSPRAAVPWIGVGLLAVLLAGGIGVLGVLGWRVMKLPRGEGPPITAANPLPVHVEPEIEPATEPVLVPVPVVAPIGVPGVPAAAALRMEIVSLTGRGSRAEVLAVFHRARADALRCAGARPMHLAVQAIFSGGGMVSIAGQHPTRRSDDRDTADCVGRAIARAGPAHFQGIRSAIVDLDVDLPARR